MNYWPSLAGLSKISGSNLPNGVGNDEETENDVEPTRLLGESVDELPEYVEDNMVDAGNFNIGFPWGVSLLFTSEPHIVRPINVSSTTWPGIICWLIGEDGSVCLENDGAVEGCVGSGLDVIDFVKEIVGADEGKAYVDVDAVSIDSGIARGPRTRFSVRSEFPRDEAAAANAAA